jgi:hypothetical protein
MAERSPRRQGRRFISSRPDSCPSYTRCYRNWIWVGDFLWLTIEFDHRFEELNPTQTKITFALEARGFGKSILARIFAKIDSKTLDRTILSRR